MTLRTPAAVVWVSALLLLQKPLMTRLKSVTLQEFTAYSQQVKKECEGRIDSVPIHFAIDDSRLRQVEAGAVLVWPRPDRNPVPIKDGLVHDWTGDIFMGHADARAVLGVLQDFDRHARIYADMTRSRLLRKSDNQISGYWRMSRRSGIVDITLDLYDDAQYLSPALGKWLIEAHTPRIIQIDDPGSPQEKALPDGVGYGFLWRLDAYWLIAERDGGVFVECRTLSLSRGIPTAVAWMINPFVSSQPRDALRSTLESTKQAVERRQ